MVAKVAVPLAISAIILRNVELLALALDVAVPPLTFLALSSAAAFTLAGLAFSGGLSPVPLVISGTSLTALFLTILLCWFRFGRDLLPIGAVGALGPFILDKIHLYRGLLCGDRPSQWTRTDRTTSETASRLNRRDRAGTE